jgi:hypothetical protein
MASLPVVPSSDWFMSTLDSGDCAVEFDSELRIITTFGDRGRLPNVDAGATVLEALLPESLHSCLPRVSATRPAK